ncbi:MAG: tRNA guanosine(34) transglycosylase Tgt [bacterium]|nr:tRNA guanosine(34) transglycosylase Tgt [bacterium]
MFRIEQKMEKGLGRAGVLETPHGSIRTPAFVTVGTKATVKALTPEQVKETGSQVVLANTYHLYLEPGEKIVEQGGGLGKFMGWEGPTMTDSGGFQVFSLGGGSVSKVQKKHSNILKNVGMSERDEALSPLVKIDEDGVTFKSYKDGSTHRFTPERSIEIQHAIGADIIFAFDECTSPTASYEYQKEAMERTHRWAARSLERHRELKIENAKLKNADKKLSANSHELAYSKGPMLFGIVQGGRFEDLRKESARFMAGLRIDGLAPSERSEFSGFGIGGSFDKEDMGSAVRWVNELLPEEKPRHLLGIGDPLDLFGAVENGCDLFDCVAPTRQARTGSLYTRHGRFNIENAKYKNDFSPVEQGCTCYTCKHFTRAYLAHLFRSNEILANTLASIHNVHFIVNLVKQMREGIITGTFSRLKEDFFASYKK